MKRENFGDQPAFPATDPNGILYHGMTLRDYFAASALKGLLANSSFFRPGLRQKDTSDFYTDSEYQIIADEAYEMADAMLKARMP